MSLTKIIKNTKGDTIVEVLISMAVLSLVLMSSYALANQSSQRVVQTQERAEALKFAEEQLERLPSYVASQPDRLTAWSDNKMCIGIDAATQQPTAYLDSEPQKCGRGTGGRYLMNVEYDVASRTYTVTASWFNLGGTGTGQDTLSLSYRLPSEASIDPFDPSNPSTLPSQCNDRADNDLDQGVGGGIDFGGRNPDPDCTSPQDDENVWDCNDSFVIGNDCTDPSVKPPGAP